MLPSAELTEAGPRLEELIRRWTRNRRPWSRAGKFGTLSAPVCGEATCPSWVTETRTEEPRARPQGNTISDLFQGSYIFGEASCNINALIA